MEQTSPPARATVAREPGFRHHLAWCPPCSDGLRGTRAKAEAWAAQHNMDRHPQGPTEGSEEAPC